MKRYVAGKTTLTDPANSSQSQPQNVPPVEPPPVDFDPNTQPPPPPEPIRSDSDSSDEDDGQQPWHPIAEDTSSPDEAELKEIEAGAEVSGLDHDHWENKAFVPLEEPEYTAAASGRIEWAIDSYNGTREKPNRDLVMKSPPINVGGYEWQIKFYPRGNDSDYLSIYVECLSVVDKAAKGISQGSENTPKKDGEASPAAELESKPTTSESSSPENVELQHTPLPLLDSKPVPKRKSVAAQVSVVLYNPSEPRVNYSRTCLHRFCTGSPDWGWTRFHGPYYDIAHRLRGQRQALLRNDKLAFTGYIRVVDDETNCLWEHHSNENPWDSFAMTGLQSLTLGEGTGSPGGNMISAIASWLLFKPFRQFLYQLNLPDPEQEPFVQPKPLLGALQKVLYMLRTQVAPGAGPVALDDVLDALDWYGVHDRLDKLDVIELWEILRLKLEHELKETPYADVLNTLFGPKRDHTLGAPSYRVPVVGMGSMQEAVNKTTDLTDPSQPLPGLLTIELQRQEFDVATRSYVKVLNKVTLDDHISVRGTPYTLFGFVVHKQTLQSYIYQPMLRPEGPGSRWYNYTDGKEENIVKCLTQRQAVDAHEGKSGSGKATGNEPVAYIAMYIRDDVAQTALSAQADAEQWDVPGWIRIEVEKQQAAPIPRPISPSPGEEQEPAAEKESQPASDPLPPQEHDFHVIDSRAYATHEGPGTFDAYNSKWIPGNSELVFTVTLSARDGCKEIRDKLAQHVKDIKDPRQIKFWFLDTMRGSYARPNLLGTGKIEYSSGSTDHYADQSKEWTLQDSPYSWSSRRLWIHIIDVADLPELPKEVPKEAEPEQQADIQPSDTTAPEASSSESATPPPPAPETQPEDTPMSEPDEPDEGVAANEAASPEVQSPETPSHMTPPPPAESGDPGPTDTAMVEVEVEVAVEAAPAADPSPVDVVIANSSTPLDTEMGGTQDTLPPPPPPPVDLATEPVPPMPAVPEPSQPAPPPDEIYFFLKFFDPENQTLESRGTHIAQKSARVDTTVLTILGLPSDKKIELVEEDDLSTTHPIRLRRSFAQNDLHNTTIIIATTLVSDELRNSLAAQALFADVQPYLALRALARNFPSRLNGHFTQNSFSSQFYKGEIKNGYRHGHGTRIYHSGATYEGQFQLDQRHGHGLYTFQNGDTYDGDWVANQQHGSGTFVEAATGNTYVGGWKNDKKFGEGVTHWKNAQETERLCRICWEEGADAAFYDCGHVVACLACARQVQSCPVCRKRVVCAMKLYYVA
jgi:hypothetical protein